MRWGASAVRYTTTKGRAIAADARPCVRIRSTLARSTAAGPRASERRGRPSRTEPCSLADGNRELVQILGQRDVGEDRVCLGEDRFAPAELR